MVALIRLSIRINGYLFLGPARLGEQANQWPANPYQHKENG